MTSPVRRVALGAAGVALLLGGCGSERAVEPGGEPGGSTGAYDDGTSPTGAAAARQLAIVTVTAAGGEIDPVPTPLRSAADVSAYAEQFDGNRMGRTLQRSFRTATVPPDQTLVASVVAIGCEVPTEVSILGPPGDLRIDPVLDRSSPVECFAPMTSVALVLLGDDLLP